MTVALLSPTVLVPETAAKDAPAPQFVRFGETGLARTTLVGRVSVYEVWVRSVFVSLLLTVIVSVLVCPTQTVLGLKPFVMDGGVTAITVIVALAGVVLVIDTIVPSSLPDAERLFAEIVLIKFPETVEVTLTST